jgi:SAM-dependent methyltransferase
MDAHHLDFIDESFDFVFGGGILHHLDFEVAIKEVHRVLKRDGRILFFEPLGRNPVGKIVRKLTPTARTPDEKPLDKGEFEILKKYFDLRNTYYQLFYVPAGFVSKFLFKSPKNPLMWGADALDRFIEFSFKKTPVVLYFRYVLIYGVRRNL